MSGGDSDGQGEDDFYDLKEYQNNDSLKRRLSFENQEDEGE